MERSEEKKRGRGKSKQALPMNSSDLLVFLHKNWPNDTPMEAEERFVRNSETAVYQQEQSRFWYSLHRRRLLEPVKEMPKTSPMNRQAEVEQQAASIVQDVRKHEFLNMMVGEKKLRDMTREECEHMGGFFDTLATRMNPGQKVGDVFTEKDLASLYKRR
jgi:hypothetical protein